MRISRSIASNIGSGASLGIGVAAAGGSPAATYSKAPLAQPCNWTGFRIRAISGGLMRALALAAGAALLSTALTIGARAQQVTGSGTTATCVENANSNTEFACGAGSTALAGQVASATAVGVLATATGDNSTAVGSGDSPYASAQASGRNSTAVGAISQATGKGSTALGAWTLAGGPLGGFVSAGDSWANDGTTAIGSFAAAGSTAAGQTNATAVGYSAQANAANATASGANSVASGTGSSAFGASSTASGYGATAVGNGAAAGFANSAAFGYGATATATNQVAVGTASNTYKLAGLTSAASLAAQSGPVSLVTTDAAGHLATTNLTVPDISGLQSTVSGLQSTVSGLQSSVGILQQEMKQSFEGTAIAISMGGSALPADKKFAVSTNWGNFRGQNAASVVAQMRLNDYAVLNAGVGAGFQQGGIGSRVGVTFAW
ncbi:YadA-like family protein [Bradyrhizobium sp. UFLA05-109]